MFSALIEGQWQLLPGGFVEVGFDIFVAMVALQWFTRRSFICVVAAVMVL